MSEESRFGLSLFDDDTPEPQPAEVPSEVVKAEIPASHVKSFADLLKQAAEVPVRSVRKRGPMVRDFSLRRIECERDGTRVGE